MVKDASDFQCEHNDGLVVAMQGVCREGSGEQCGWNE